MRQPCQFACLCMASSWRFRHRHHRRIRPSSVTYDHHRISAKIKQKYTLMKFIKNHMKNEIFLIQLVTDLTYWLTKYNNSSSVQLSIWRYTFTTLQMSRLAFTTEFIVLPPGWRSSRRFLVSLIERVRSCLVRDLFIVHYRRASGKKKWRGHMTTRKGHLANNRRRTHASNFTIETFHHVYKRPRILKGKSWKRKEMRPENSEMYGWKIVGW